MTGQCLGCPRGEKPETGFRWHDGMYPSWYCVDHIRDMLPRQLKGYKQTVVEHRGKDAVVSGYAYHEDEPGRKLVTVDDLDAFLEDAEQGGGE